MTDPLENKRKFSRRRFLPVLGSTFFLPLIGFGETTPEQTIDKEKNIDNGEEYQTLLKPDGTIVKVKASTLKNSKVVKKNISNSSFLNWLGKKQ
jgi:endo-1,4-beta-mannosidase